MSTPDENPLLDFGPKIAFDRVRAADIEPAIDQLLAQARARMVTIGGTAAAPTTAGTLDALDHLTADLEQAMAVASHLEAVLGDPALRTAYNAVQPRVSAFYAGLPLDAGLYAALQAFAATPEAAALEPTRARYLHKSLDEFRRHGAALPPEDKTRLMAVETELAESTNRFSQSVVDETDAFALDVTEPGQLAGLPSSAVDAARAAAQAAGVEGWRFTLHAPSLLPAMTYLDDAGIRARLYHASHTRATRGERDNRPLVAHILALRAERARLLGYRDLADLLLEPRMVRTGEAAFAFVEDLRRRTTEHAEREHAELVAHRRELEGPDAPPLAPSDVAYYAEKLRVARFDFDEEALRPYFPVDGVLAGLFELAGRLFGVRVEPLSGWPTWHADVRTYRLSDADGRALGVFYADLFPRSGKRGGAWMHPLRFAAAPNDLHVGLMCGNLTPPVNGRPALLRHREVETLFHEFGHLLHHLLTTVDVRSLAGTNVAWDFVELPSQIMENWCWCREALDLFARHYETGEPIPQPLFERMTAARTFRAATAQMRQLSFATLDLALHREFDPARDGDPVAYARDVAQRFSPTPLPDDYAMAASFTHIFGSPVGYAAGYYSYKWAEVLDADAFTRFEREGLFSAEVGAAFRDHVLSRGDSRDPAELYAAFMGRGPDPAALFRRAGLPT